MLLPYLWWETPQFLYYIIAIAVLLAAIVTIGALTKNSELIVMRACGISLYRTAVPLLVFAALGAARCCSRSRSACWRSANRRAEYLSHIIRGGSAADLRRPQPQMAGRTQTARSITTSTSIRGERELNGAVGLRFDPATHGADATRVFATQAAYAPAPPAIRTPWIARGGWMREFDRRPKVTKFTPLRRRRRCRSSPPTTS